MRGHLAVWGHDRASDASEAIVLVVSELVTNAVRHGFARGDGRPARPSPARGGVTPTPASGSLPHPSSGPSATDADTELELAVTVLADGSCFIEVSDESSAAPEMRPGTSADGETGRGLHLVDSLAQAWGVWHRGVHGKTVWALVEA